MLNSSLLFKDESIESKQFLFNNVKGANAADAQRVKSNDKQGGNNPDVKTLLANGITSEEEYNASKNNNFFISGIRGDDRGYVSGEQIKNTTQIMSVFNNVYREFSSNPSFETANNLKNEYINVKDTNKSIDRLYKLVEPKVEELLNNS